MAFCCPPTFPDSRAGNRALPSTPLGSRPYHFLAGLTGTQLTSPQGSESTSQRQEEYRSQQGWCAGQTPLPLGLCYSVIPPAGTGWGE